MKVNDGGPAFPSSFNGEYWTSRDGEHKFYAEVEGGMSLRDYFAIHAPAPADSAIEAESKQDALRNPHGDSYKPKRRSKLEIIVDLRYAFADAMIEGRNGNTTKE